MGAASEAGPPVVSSEVALWEVAASGVVVPPEDVGPGLTVACGAADVAGEGVGPAQAVRAVQVTSAVTSVAVAGRGRRRREGRACIRRLQGHHRV
ncbi:hypothetical protein GCM10010498_09510 [Streptomyces cavourensis]|nr:hypothetical protein GCM10010498_09510 [Streptomyces cavourensis]